MCSCILSAGILSPVIGEMRKDSCGGAACDCLAGMGEEGGGGGKKKGGGRRREGRMNKDARREAVMDERDGQRET